MRSSSRDRSRSGRPGSPGETRGLARLRPITVAVARASSRLWEHRTVSAVRRVELLPGADLQNLVSYACEGWARHGFTPIRFGAELTNDRVISAVSEDEYWRAISPVAPLLTDVHVQFTCERAHSIGTLPGTRASLLVTGIDYSDPLAASLVVDGANQVVCEGTADVLQVAVKEWVMAKRATLPAPPPLEATMDAVAAGNDMVPNEMAAAAATPTPFAAKMVGSAIFGGLFTATSFSAFVYGWDKGPTPTLSTVFGGLLVALLVYKFGWK